MIYNRAIYYLINGKQKLYVRDERDRVDIISPSSPQLDIRMELPKLHNANMCEVLFIVGRSWLPRDGCLPAPPPPPPQMGSVLIEDKWSCALLSKKSTWYFLHIYILSMYGCQRICAWWHLLERILRTTTLLFWLKKCRSEIRSKVINTKGIYTPLLMICV